MKSDAFLVLIIAAKKRRLKTSYSCILLIKKNTAKSRIQILVLKSEKHGTYLYNVSIKHIRRKYIFRILFQLHLYSAWNSDSYKVKGDIKIAWTLETDGSGFIAPICYYLFCALGKVYPTFPVSFPL